MFVLGKVGFGRLTWRDWARWSDECGLTWRIGQECLTQRDWPEEFGLPSANARLPIYLAWMVHLRLPGLASQPCSLEAWVAAGEDPGVAWRFLGWVWEIPTGPGVSQAPT